MMNKKTTINKYPLIKKAYWVGHKTTINNMEGTCHPEQVGGQIVRVQKNEGANRAKRIFFSEEHDLLPSDAKYIDIRARRLNSEDAYLYEGQPRCMSLIRQSEARKEWRSRMERMVSENPNARVYIHSGQWDAYWGANASGYTNNPANVGVYSIEEAWKLVSHCGIEKKIEFQIVK